MKLSSQKSTLPTIVVEVTVELQLEKDPQMTNAEFKKMFKSNPDLDGELTTAFHTLIVQMLHDQHKLSEKDVFSVGTTVKIK